MYRSFPLESNVTDNLCLKTPINARKGALLYAFNKGVSILNVPNLLKNVHFNLSIYQLFQPDRQANLFI